MSSRSEKQHSPGLRPTRRQVLKLGALGLFNTLPLPGILQAHAEGVAADREKSVESIILLEHYGAPSHIDTWDPKPEAPDSIRGEFGTIETTLPGYRVTDIMPRTARLCDRLCIVRSMSHKIFNHNPGTYQSITGNANIQDVVQVANSPSDWPAYGSVMARFSGSRGNVPPFVSLPVVAYDQVYKCPGQWGGLLGNAYDPFFIAQDPNREDFRVGDFDLPGELSFDRLDDRRRLLNQIDAAARRFEQLSLKKQLDANYARAFDLLTSPGLKRAFDLASEPAALRDRYGRHMIGQSLLLARRLVESGVRFVTCFSGSNPGDPLGWDTHGDNFNRLKNRLMPQDDQAYSALIEDLDSRGLLDSTLVIWAGEFGRKPQIAEKGLTFVGEAGRDHWPFCYTIALAGGRAKRGYLFGNSDAQGAHPGSEPTTPQDVAATLYWTMGIDPHATHITDQFGRHVPLSTEGRILRELFA